MSLMQAVPVIVSITALTCVSIWIAGENTLLKLELKAKEREIEALKFVIKDYEKKLEEKAK